jgi:hypothetical protein
VSDFKNPNEYSLQIPSEHGGVKYLVSQEEFTGSNFYMRYVDLKIISLINYVNDENLPEDDPCLNEAFQYSLLIGG